MVNKMNSKEAEIIKKKYFYRRLILSGKVKLNIEQAKKFIGPDSAFHLYCNYNKNKK